MLTELSAVGLLPGWKHIIYCENVFVKSALRMRKELKMKGRSWGVPRVTRWWLYETCWYTVLRQVDARRCVGEQRSFPRLRYSGGGDVESGVGVTARRAEVISSSGDNRDLDNNQLFRSRNQACKPHPTPHSHKKLTVILESVWGYLHYITCT